MQTSAKKFAEQHNTQRLAHGVDSALLHSLPADIPLPPPRGAALRVMQWNLLADGLSEDGFLVCDVLAPEPGTKPTVASRQAELSNLAEECADAHTKKDEAKLKALQQSLAGERSAKNHTATVAWRCRWPRMLATIASASPDVVCFQELDHLPDAIEGLGALGYVCAPPGRSYVPCHTNKGVTCGRADAAYDASAFLNHLERIGVAYAPKCPSTCRQAPKGPQPAI